MVSAEIPAKRAAEVHQPVDREHPDAAAIGEYRKALAGEGLEVAERLGGGEQFIEILHAQEAGAAESGIIDGIGAGKRAGVSCRGSGSLCVASGFDDDNGLDARRGPRRRHELARIADGLDVQEDRARAAIEGEEIEQVAEIDVDLISKRDDRRESDAPACRPFDESCNDGARLRHQREIAGLRISRGKAGIEMGAGDHDAKTVRADDAQPMCPRRLPGCIGEGSRSMAET